QPSGGSLRRSLQVIRNRWYVVADLLILFLGTVLGYLARFEGAEGLQQVQADFSFLVLSAPLRVAVLWALGVYRVLWRHASARDFVRLGAAGALAGAVNLVFGAVAVGPLGLL